MTGGESGIRNRRPTDSIEVAENKNAKNSAAALIFVSEDPDKQILGLTLLTTLMSPRPRSCYAPSQESSESSSEPDAQDRKNVVEMLKAIEKSQLRRGEPGCPL
jgi:hypothetical protein